MSEPQVTIYFDLVTHWQADIPLNMLRRLAPDSDLEVPSENELRAVPPYQVNPPVEAGGDLVDWLLTDGVATDGGNPVITEMMIE